MRNLRRVEPLGRRSPVARADERRHRPPRPRRRGRRRCWARPALAMRRLSIIDLARGHQPIANEDGTAWIVFNGEIYNHRELRRDLLSARPPLPHRQRHRGHPPPLRGARRARASTICAGMFAFAIWDSRRARLAARPRPLRPEAALLALRRPALPLRLRDQVDPRRRRPRGARPEIDLRSLDEYLTLRFIPSPRTMFPGIHKLPPAHLLVLDASTSSRRGRGTCRPRPRSRCGATGSSATSPSGAITRPSRRGGAASASARRSSPT